MKYRALLGLLADGQIHSGESLARELGVSRTAIWKRIGRAVDQGYAIETLRGRGYRLLGSADLLDADVILAQLPESIRHTLALQVHDQLDSTNAEIIRQRPVHDSNKLSVCLADHQTAGRGRRGRQWQSPRGENLYLSMGLNFRGGFAVLDGLSLVFGLAVAEALESLGLGGVGLKWPNDVFFDHKKLAGILVELHGELEEGMVQVTVGIGINVHMTHAEGLDQAWTSLSQLMPDPPWQRNQIAAAVIASIIGISSRFESTGFRAFVEPWQARDILQGKPLQTASGDFLGIGRGVDEVGNYLVEKDGKVHKVRAGEISLRMRS